MASLAVGIVVAAAVPLTLAAVFVIMAASGKNFDRITLGALIRQTEENLALVECFSSEPHACPISPACRLAGVLDDALTAFFDVLDRKTLSDVLEPRQQLLQLMVPVERSAERSA